MDRYVKNETTGAADTAPVFESQKEFSGTAPTSSAVSASFHAGSASCFSLSVRVLGREITAYVILPDEGIHVTVCGGEKSHIGAVSVVDPDGARHDMQFPTHKDGVIASEWADALHQAGYCPVVAEAGIHYDDLSKEGIAAVVDAADQLLAQVLRKLPDHH